MYHFWWYKIRNFKFTECGISHWNDCHLLLQQRCATTQAVTSPAADSHLPSKWYKSWRLKYALRVCTVQCLLKAAYGSGSQDNNTITLPTVGGKGRMGPVGPFPIYCVTVWLDHRSSNTTVRYVPPEHCNPQIRMTEASYLPGHWFLLRLWWSTPGERFIELPADQGPWSQHLVEASASQSMAVHWELSTHWDWHESNDVDETGRPSYTFMSRCSVHVTSSHDPAVSTSSIT